MYVFVLNYVYYIYIYLDKHNKTTMEMLSN